MGGTANLDLALFVVLAILFAASLVWLLAAYLRWWSRVYVVTDHRVLVQRGILNLALDEIPVDQIRGVDVFQSLWHRVLGYGTIRISSEFGRGIGNEDWEGIPRPFEFQRLVETAVEDMSPQHLARVLARGVPAVATPSPPIQKPPTAA